ncbi:hypothetical protein D3C78_330590 [compost metagenome]
MLNNALVRYSPVRLSTNMEVTVSGFICNTCGKPHDELPMCFGPSAPDLWYSIPETERDERGELSSDQCVIDGEHFFVLGRILIPVTDGVGPFAWLAWISLSESNFLRMCELWERDGREAEPPYCGWLQSDLPYEPSTLGLEIQVQTMPLGERPLILFDHTVHPLSVEQYTGITMARVQSIVEAALHG